VQIATDRRPLVSAPATESLEEMAFRYGRSYDAYLATEPDRQVFRSHDRRGAVAYVQRGRYLYASGGLLAGPEAQGPLLEELVAYADRAGLVPAFFNCHDDEVPLFREHGFQVTKCGEEALVDLRVRTWQGKEFEWVRRQSNYCRRQDVRVDECHERLMPQARWHALIAELTAVSAASLATKPQRAEINFLEGRFTPEQMGRRRLFIARAQQGRGRVEGFLVCHPCLDGARWVFETYRHRPDAVRGVCAFLMHEAMRTLETDGARSVSLCLVPGLRCRQPLPGDSALARWSLVVGTKYFGMIHDTAGMYHFKSRFRPRFENRYVCVRPRITLAWAWGLVRMLGVLRLDPRVVVADSLGRWRKRKTRKTLKALTH